MTREMLRYVICVASGIALCSVIAHASEPDLSTYPLRVQVMQATATRTAFGTTGYGKANLEQDGHVQGFEYTFNCPDPFLPSDGPDRYPARWKDVGTKIRILTHKIGSNSHSECELKVSLHSFVFEMKDGELVTASEEQVAKQNAAAIQFHQELNPADVDPTHYPLKVFLLTVDWNPQSAYGYSGSGQGNVQDGDKMNAMDFNIHCPAKLLPSVEGHYLKGRWGTQDSHLMIITHKVGDATTTHQCDISTTVKANIYVLQPSGSIAELTQAQYAAQH